jgi:hypothetical protein
MREASVYVARDTNSTRDDLRAIAAVAEFFMCSICFS